MEEIIDFQMSRSMTKGFRSISPRHRQKTQVVMENEEHSSSKSGKEEEEEEEEKGGEKVPPIIFI